MLLLLMFFGVQAVVTGQPRNKTLICNTNSDQTTCRNGTCITKLIFTNASEAPLVVMGCQKAVSKKKVNSLNKCSFEKFNGQPYAIEYSTPDDEGNAFYFYKMCCWTNYCNQKEKTKAPFIYLRTMLATDVISHTPVMLMIMGSFVIGAMTAALIRVWKVFHPLEYPADSHFAIDPVLVEAAGEYTVMQLLETVTGQMSISETINVISEMTEDPDATVTHTVTGDSVVKILPGKLLTAGGHGHALVQALRSKPHHLQSILFRMIEHGPYEFPFKPMELLELFDEAKDVFFSDDSLIFMSAPIVVIGDLRGAYADLHRWLSIVGWPPRTRLLFLGNTMNCDEPGSLECIALISALKIAFPHEVFLLRGITESLPFVPLGRFPLKSATAISSSIQRMCTFLPTAALLMEKILAVPSGISPQAQSISDLCDLPRPAPLDYLKPIQRNLIFDQPSTKVRMHRPNPDSRGSFFGPMAVEKARKNLGIQLFIRGNSPVPYGFLPSWSNSVLTIWSSPAKGTQIGAILIVNADLEVEPILMQAQPELLKSGEDCDFGNDATIREATGVNLTMSDSCRREFM